MYKTIPSLFFTIIFGLLPYQHVYANPDDSPSPQLLKEKATILRDAASQLGRDYLAASKGKNWGHSPGHKALYQSIFAYRNELQTVTEMSKPGSLPDRLLTIAMDCKIKSQAMANLAVFVIIPDSLLQQINELSKRSKELLAPIQQYEQRYFTWRKVDLERKHASDLALLQRELADLKSNQKHIIQRTNEIAAQDDCPPQEVIVIEQPHNHPPRPPQPRKRKPKPPVCPTPSDE